MEDNLIDLIFEKYQNGSDLIYELINKLSKLAEKNRKKLTKREKNELGEKLLKSCREKNIKSSLEVILQGANFNFKDSDGNTPLLEAVRNDDILFLKILLHLKANPDILNNSKESPINLAIQIGNKEILKTLIDNACNLNIKNSGGKTPLILAIEKCWFDIAEALIKAGASLDEQDRNGNTALILAVIKNSYLAELLLENFANPLIRNNAGENAYDRCIYERNILKFHMIFYLSFISKNEEEFYNGLRVLNFNREDLNISMEYFLGKCDHYRLKYLLKVFI